MNCPAFEQLIDTLDSAGPVVNAGLNLHLQAGCQNCNDDLNWYRRVSMIASEDASLEPPAWVLNRAFKVFEKQNKLAKIARAATKLVAALIFDSGVQPTFAMARSGATQGRQLLYRAGDFSIDIVIQDPTNNSAMKGQILKTGEDSFESVKGAEVSLVRRGRANWSTRANEQGEFEFPSAIGKFDLRIITEEQEITIKANLLN